jgi:hypothetical protein
MWQKNGKIKINEIQKYLIDILSSQNAIASEVNGIFTHVPNNNKFPYIHIGNFVLEDLATKTEKYYKLFFNISIYSRMRNYDGIFLIADEIQQLLSKDQFLKNLQFLGLEINQKSDGITSFANLKFKLLIGEN